MKPAPGLDDLIAGSTMVEMMEAFNQALRHATPNSLILFDELDAARQPMMEWCASASHH